MKEAQESWVSEMRRGKTSRSAVDFSNIWSIPSKNNFQNEEQMAW